MTHQLPARIHGSGVRARHSRRCKIPADQRHDGCVCEPSFEAFVWLGARKKRRTFRTVSEARAWRLQQLRRLYDIGEQRAGRLDTAYGLLRKTAQELDRALTGTPRGRTRATIREALDDLYRAEERVLDAMKG